MYTFKPLFTTFDYKYEKINLIFLGYKTATKLFLREKYKT